MASLGTLTVDLVANTGGFVLGMDKGSKEASKFRRNVEREVKAAGKAIAASTAAVGAAVVALTAQTTKAATEIARQSKLANASVTEFQRFAAGSRAVGVEQDKLSDILKDVNDKVGDFLTTGGGPLKDFFDEVAPKIGVTADQFRNLSGPDALQLYVSSLEKANLSQAELTFFMEAIANDATLLLPLLQDNGKAMGEFADAAEKAGTILDEETVEAAVDLKIAMGEIAANVDAAKKAIAAEMIPAVRDLAILFDELRIDTDNANEAGAKFVTILKGVAGAAVTAFGAVELLAKGIAGAGASFAALSRQEGEGFFSTEPLKRAAGVANEALADLEKTRDRYRQLLVDVAAINTDFSGAALGTRSARDGRRKALGGGGAIDETETPAGVLNNESQDKFLEQQQKFEDKLRRLKEKAANMRRDDQLQHMMWEQQITEAGQRAQIQSTEASLSQLSGVARQWAGEQSEVYRALFAVEKAAAIARSIIAIQTAIAQASTAGPFPANLAAMASVAAATAGLISNIASTTIQGQAHDGLMSVPTTGTYILEKGERVTTAETSAKMDSMIDDARNGGMGGVRIVNAFDTGEVLGGYLGSSEGEEVIMNVVRRNAAAIRSFG
jgi:hypothetical protein